MVIGKSVHAVLPGIAIVEGIGTTFGCELDRATLAPPAGTAAVSWTATRPDAPLYMIPGLPSGAIETGVAGAELIVNVLVVDGSVTALVVGDESPCCERTRQNFCPGVSDNNTAIGSVYWLLKTSIVEKFASVATSHRYPMGCGLGT